jgi:aminoglycoside 3-N-acetyltransferase I
MRALNRVFAVAFDEAELYERAPPRAAYLESRLALPHLIVLTATVEHDVVGGIVAYELDKLERERREIYLYDLAVAEPHRRRGIATALIRRLREIAHERGAWAVFVQADYADPPAVALYEGLGAREEVLHFDLTPLPPREPLPPGKA